MALAGLRTVLQEDLDERAKAGLALERIEHLEHSRTQWEAVVEGAVLKAEGKLKAANNAESRARTMMNHAEKFIDPFDEDGVEGQEQRGALPLGDVEGSREEGVQPLHLDVAVDDKTNALRRKFF